MLLIWSVHAGLEIFFFSDEKISLQQNILPNAPITLQVVFRRLQTKIKAEGCTSCKTYQHIFIWSFANHRRILSMIRLRKIRKDIIKLHKIYCKDTVALHSKHTSFSGKIEIYRKTQNGDQRQWKNYGNSTIPYSYRQTYGVLYGADMVL